MNVHIIIKLRHFLENQLCVCVSLWSRKSTFFFISIVCSENPELFVFIPEFLWRSCGCGCVAVVLIISLELLWGESVALSAPSVELRLIQASLCFSKAWNKPQTVPLLAGVAPGEANCDFCQSKFAGAILVPRSASLNRDGWLVYFCSFFKFILVAFESSVALRTNVRTTSLLPLDGNLVHWKRLAVSTPVLGGEPLEGSRSR